MILIGMTHNFLIDANVSLLYLNNTIQTATTQQCCPACGDALSPVATVVKLFTDTFAHNTAHPQIKRNVVVLSQLVIDEPYPSIIHCTENYAGTLDNFKRRQCVSTAHREIVHSECPRCLLLPLR